ncbi:unnamed protein product [Diamesa serratosioi]
MDKWRVAFNQNPLLIYVVAVYALTRSIEYILGAKDFWPRFWNKIIDVVGDDPFKVTVYASTVYATSLYWIVGGFLMYAQVTKKPAFMQKYKIQQKKDKPVDMDKLKSAIKRVICNQLFVSLPFTYYLMKKANNFNNFDLRNVPSFSLLMRDLAICTWMFEFAFYISHRLLHSAFMYKHVHKTHHEWKTPLSIVSIYCHPVEHIMSNMFPALLGPFVMSSHVSTSWIWLGITTITTLVDHSGFHIPFLHSSEAHDWHHLKFNESYGANGFMDSIHDTDEHFIDTINGKRHKTYWSGKSAREQYPDEIKKQEILMKSE